MFPKQLIVYRHARRRVYCFAWWPLNHCVFVCVQRSTADSYQTYYPRPIRFGFFIVTAVIGDPNDWKITRLLRRDGGIRASVQVHIGRQYLREFFAFFFFFLIRQYRSRSIHHCLRESIIDRVHAIPRFPRLGPGVRRFLRVIVWKSVHNHNRSEYSLRLAYTCIDVNPNAWLQCRYLCPRCFRRFFILWKGAKWTYSRIKHVLMARYSWRIRALSIYAFLSNFYSLPRNYF